MPVFSKIHKDILKRSHKFVSLHNEIKTNGIIIITKSNMDLFSFLLKTIISQQISYRVANSIWNKISVILKSKKLNIKDFRNKEKLTQLLKEVRVSSIKSEYILGIYDAFKKNKINENQIKKLNETTLRHNLMQYRGIGKWTCDMVLIFFFKISKCLPSK